MRFDPSAPAPRRAAAVGAALACGVLLAGCDSESLDDDSFSLDEWFSADEWFSFGDDEDADGEAEGEETEEEESEEEAEDEGEPFALPDSCAEIGADEVAGGLAPAGAVVAEDIGKVEGTPDAEQVSCVWSGAGQGGSESFALVFTVNADPGASLEVARVPGEEEMNWEVDIDVDVDNYRNPQADALGGELDYVATVEGSTQSLHLSLPDDFYVSAIAVSSEAGQEDLERVVFQAAERVQR